jgi:hypothetical protein
MRTRPRSVTGHARSQKLNKTGFRACVRTPRYRALKPLRGAVGNRHPCPETKDRVPHPSRSLRRVGCHSRSPEALPRNVCLSHPSLKARRMGHPFPGSSARCLSSATEFSRRLFSPRGTVFPPSELSCALIKRCPQGLLEAAGKPLFEGYGLQPVRTAVESMRLSPPRAAISL